MTKFTINAARRPSVDDDISALLYKVKSMFSADSPWYVDADYDLMAGGTQGEFAVHSQWKLVPFGLKGQFSLWIREDRFIADNASNSDRLLYKFNSRFLKDQDPFEAVRKLVLEFGAYSVRLHEETFDVQSYNHMVELNRQAAVRRQNVNIGGRHSIWNIAALNYWDRELCMRAFDLYPMDLVKCFAPHVDVAECFGDGVWIQPSHDLSVQYGRDEAVELMKRAGLGNTLSAYNG